MSLGFAPCGSLSLDLGVLNVDFRICHLVVGCYPQRFGSLLQRCFHEVGVILEKLLVIYSKPGKLSKEDYKHHIKKKTAFYKGMHIYIPVVHITELHNQVKGFKSYDRHTHKQRFLLTNYINKIHICFHLRF